MMFPLLKSSLMVLFRVFLGLTRLFDPGGVHSHACFAILFSSIRRAWPWYFHLLRFIVVTMLSLLALSMTLSLLI